jgi:hypothetical protein
MVAKLEEVWSVYKSLSVVKVKQYINLPLWFVVALLVVLQSGSGTRMSVIKDRSNFTIVPVFNFQAKSYQN